MLRQQWAPSRNGAGRVAAQPAGHRCCTHKGSVSPVGRNCSGSHTAAQKSENDAFWNDVGISLPTGLSGSPLAVDLGRWQPSLKAGALERPGSEKGSTEGSPPWNSLAESWKPSHREHPSDQGEMLAQLQPGRGSPTFIQHATQFSTLARLTFQP